MKKTIALVLFALALVVGFPTMLAASANSPPQMLALDKNWDIESKGDDQIEQIQNIGITDLDIVKGAVYLSGESFFGAELDEFHVQPDREHKTAARSRMGHGRGLNAIGGSAGGLSFERQVHA